MDDFHDMDHQHLAGAGAATPRFADTQASGITLKGLGAAAFGLTVPGDLVPGFGMLHLAIMRMRFPVPPSGYAFFDLRGLAPPDIPVADIYKPAPPFLFVQGAGPLLCMAYPDQHRPSRPRLRALTSSAPAAPGGCDPS